MFKRLPYVIKITYLLTLHLIYVFTYTDFVLVLVFLIAWVWSLLTRNFRSTELWFTLLFNFLLILCKYTNCRRVLVLQQLVVMPPIRPTNFSWVIDGALSGCAFPSHSGHFQYLVEVGVRHLVTLTEFTPPLHLLPKGWLNYFVFMALNWRN